MSRLHFWAGPALLCALGQPASAQDLADRAADAPAAAEAPSPDDDQVRFSTDSLEYDTQAEIVTAIGDVRMTRGGDRLRADRVTWNRATGRVVATGGER